MSKELQRTLGAAARAARRSLGLTQEKVAERLDVSSEFYGRIERGTAWPSIQVFERMVIALEVSADVLLGLDPERQPEPIPLIRPGDSPELRKLMTLLRRARPEVVHLASRLTRDLEQVLDQIARDPDGDEDEDVAPGDQDDQDDEHEQGDEHDPGDPGDDGDPGDEHDQRAGNHAQGSMPARTVAPTLSVVKPFNDDA